MSQVFNSRVMQGEAVFTRRSRFELQSRVFKKIACRKREKIQGVESTLNSVNTGYKGLRATRNEGGKCESAG